MALFNVTTAPIEVEELLLPFMTSNMNINIDDDDELRISKYFITEQQWLGNLNN